MAQKVSAALLCAEGTGDFLLDFNHAHIAFDLVVVKGDAEIIHKGQDASLKIFCIGVRIKARPPKNLQNLCLCRRSSKFLGGDCLGRVGLQGDCI